MSFFESSTWTTIIVPLAKSLVIALLIFLIGRLIIKWILKLLAKSKAVEKMDPTVRNYLLSIVKVVLYVVMVVAIIGILGVPLASVITVLATCGIAVGLALQGSLSNLAGGLMLVIFRPFKVGDYVKASDVEGVVQEITMFYTIILTLDNKKVSVPNGTLMNANITNFSSEKYRRVDLAFTCARGEDVDKIQDIIRDVIDKNELVLKAPEAPDGPFAQVSGATNEAMEFTARAWCESGNYWPVYFQLVHDVTNALGEAGIAAPAVRVITDKAE